MKVYFPGLPFPHWPLSWGPLPTSPSFLTPKKLDYSWALFQHLFTVFGWSPGFKYAGDFLNAYLWSSVSPWTQTHISSYPPLPRCSISIWNWAWARDLSPPPLLSPVSLPHWRSQCHVSLSSRWVLICQLFRESFSVHLSRVSPLLDHFPHPRSKRAGMYPLFTAMIFLLQSMLDAE